MTKGSDGNALEYVAFFQLDNTATLHYEVRSDLSVHYLSAWVHTAKRGLESKGRSRSVSYIHALGSLIRQASRSTGLFLIKPFTSAHLQE